MSSPLLKWQKRNGVTNKAISEMLGVHQSFITHINKGRRKPSANLALKIEQATGGAVTLRELLFPKEATK